jgi:hypothetical protein
VVAAALVFLSLAFLTLAVSARFQPANVLADPYGFTERFFSQWSPALEAFGALIAAALALAAISESRRSQRVALRAEYLSRAESFVMGLGMLPAELFSLVVARRSVPPNEALVASTQNAVMGTMNELLRSMVFAGLAIDSIRDAGLTARYTEAKALLTGFPTGRTPDDTLSVMEAAKQFGLLSETMATRIHALKSRSGRG